MIYCLNFVICCRSSRIEYFTILKEPLWRYVSEWKHVATKHAWTGNYRCNHNESKSSDVPLCTESKVVYLIFKQYLWKGVTLDEFLKCPHNLAHNRQVRMLSDRTLIGCYTKALLSNQSEELKRLMLESAKNNLSRMKFFGLSEYMYLNQYMFEQTFKGLRFSSNLKQNIFFRNNSIQKSTYPFSESFKVSLFLQSTKPYIIDEIKKKVKFDIQFYQFAKDLYFSRLWKLLETDEKFKETGFFNTTFRTFNCSSELELHAEKVVSTLKELEIFNTKYNF